MANITTLRYLLPHANVSLTTWFRAHIELLERAALRYRM